MVMPKRTTPVKKSEVIGGYLIKYHANGKIVWSKGKLKNRKPMDTGNGTVRTARANDPVISRPVNRSVNGSPMISWGVGIRRGT